MEKQKKSRKALVVGVIAAIVVLAALLALLLTQCTGALEPAATTAQTEATTEPQGPAKYDLYWNVDRKDYMVQSGEEVGSTGRTPDADGYYHVIFAKDGEQMDLRVIDRRLVNRIDGTDLMGLVFDENGIVVDLITLDNMPLEKIGFGFYIQSMGGKAVKINSSSVFDGMELVVKMNDSTLILDTSGWSEFVGAPAKLQVGDRVYVIANEDGDITHIFLYERDGIESVEVRYCKHCEEEVEWASWMKGAELPRVSGHYFLTKDVALPKQMAIKEDNAQICLDLNGHFVEGKGGDRLYSTFTFGVKLAVMDNSEAKTGYMKTTGQNMDQGGVLWARYGTIDMYDITLDATGSTTKNGGNAVAVENDAVFTMHSGKIVGGTATNTGGNVVVNSKGKFVLKSGLITKGTTRNANGGNVAVNGKDATFVMEGGTISYGTANKGKGNSNGIGGNIYNSGTFIMYGGTITGGTVRDQNGKSMEADSNRNMVIVNGSLQMSGGRIDGYVWAFDTSATDARTANVRLSGSAKITGAAEGHTNLSFSPRAELKLGKLNSNALIKLSGLTSNKIYNRPENMTDEQWAGYEATAGRLFNDTGTLKGALKEDGIYFVGAESIEHCLCGANEGEEHIGACDGTVQTWYSWSGSTLPYDTGYYYLKDDVKLLTYHSFNSASIKDYIARDVYIDLNGHNITFAEGMDERPLAITTTPADITLTLTDASEGHTGKVVREVEHHSQGMLVWLRARTTGALGVMNLYRVTMDASKITDAIYGGALLVEAGNTLNMYEATVLGASAENGAAIYIEGGEVNMFGGKIVAGKVTGAGAAVSVKGGSMSLAGNAQFVVSEECNDVYLENNGFLKFDESWTGNGEKAIKLDMATDMGILAEIPEEVAEETLKAWTDSFVVSEEYSILVDGNTLWLVQNEDEEVQLPPVSEEDGFTLTNHCVCGANVGEYHIGTCDGVAVTWQEWTSTDSMPTENGNWYLTADVTFAKDTRWMVGKTDSSKLNVDLNGHTVTYDQGLRMLTIYRDAEVNTHLIITDSSAGHTGKLVNKGPATGYEGTVLYMYNGATKSKGNADIYRVALDASQTSCTNGGGVIRVDEGHTLNLYGANVIGCPAMEGSVAYLYGGTMNVADGSVLTAAKVTGNGGAIFSGDKSILNIYDSTVIGCEASSGGAIYSLGTLTFGGETTITGDLYLKDMLGLRADYTGNGETPITVKLADGSGKLVNKIPGLDLNALKDNFVTTSDRYVIAVESDGIYVNDTSDNPDIPDGYEPVDPTSHCLCGANNGEQHIGVCDGTLLTWTPWTGNTLPTESGYYYAAHEGKTVNLDYTGYTKGSVSAEVNIVIDLNGKTFNSARNNRAFAILDAAANVNLTLTDSSILHTGKILAPGRNADVDGALVFMQKRTAAQATLSIYRATLDAAKIIVSGERGGAGIQIETGNTLYLYNAKIVGGSVQRGGALYLNGGTVYMEGGTLVAGNGVESGGAVAVRSMNGANSKFYMKNSKDGSEAVIDATEKSVSNAGGAVNIDGYGGWSQFFMDEGKIIGGTATGAGGGAVVVQDTMNNGSENKGVFHMNGGVVIGGIANSTNSGYGGGNIRVTTGGVFNMNGGSIVDGYDKGGFKAGGVLVTGTNSKITVSGTASISGNEGCDLYLNGGKTLTVAADWAGNGSEPMVVDIPNHAGKFAVAGEGATLAAEQFTGVVIGETAYKAVAKADGLYLEVDPDYDPNATEPTTEATEPEETEPSTEATEPEETEPSTEATEPEETEPSTEATEPEETEPSTEATEPEETLPPVMEVVTPDSHCICGATDGEYHIGNCDGVVLEWKPWTSTTSMPTENGNWYLTGNVTFGGTDRWMIGKTDNSALNVDLNGYTVSYAANIRAVTVYLESPVETNVNITDSSKGHEGKIVNSYTGNCTYAGSVLYMYSQGTKVTEKATLSFYRGTLDAANVNSNADGGTLRTEMNMTLNLFGATVKGSVAKNGGAIYNFGGTINIDDGCVITGAKVTGNGGAIYNIGGLDNAVGVITIKDSTVNGAEAVSGGAIWNKGTLSMTDSVINGAKSSRGGALHIEGGKVTMEGGKLVGADTTENGTVIDMKPTAEASFTMKNSKKQTAILDGTGTTAGNTGAINIDGWAAKATFTMESGEIIGATATRAGGGAVCVQDTSGNMRAFFVMNGGTISGGVNNSTTDGHGGGNVRVTTGGNFAMNGGTITGGKDNGTRNASGVMVTGTGTMTISGSAKITGNADCDLYLNNTNFTVGADWAGNGGETMNITTITELAEDAVLFAPAADLTDAQWSASVAGIRDGIASGKIVINGTAAEEGKINGFTVYYGQESVKLIAAADGVRYGCLCGANVGESHIGDCQVYDIEWTAWDKTDSMPTENGYWYLTGDVSYTEIWRLNNTDMDSSNVNVDLNGHTVTYTGTQRAITAYRRGTADAFINLTDSSVGHTAKIVNGNTSVYEASLIYLYNNEGKDTNSEATISVYRMSLDASKIVGSDTNNNGGAMRAEGGTTLNLYGVTATGSTTNVGGVLYNHGGTINVEDSVLNGYATRNNGGVLYNGRGTTNIKDSTINGVKVSNHGGAIHNSATLNIENSIINAAQTEAGVNVAVDGGAIFNTGTATMTGGKIIAGHVSTSGGAIAAHAGNFTVTDVEIDASGKVAGNRGTAVAVGNSSAVTFTMNGNTVIKGGSTGGPGSGAVTVQDTGSSANAQFIMNGGMISGGQSTSSNAVYGGGNVRVTSGGKFFMNGGTITGGTATNGIGGVMLTGTGTMTISGDAKIYGNDGCDLFLNNRVLTIGADWKGNGETAMVINTAAAGDFANAGDGLTFTDAFKAYFACTGKTVEIVDNKLTVQ